MIKVDSIAVNDNPAIILDAKFLGDSIVGRIDKIDEMFDKGFNDRILIVNKEEKIEIPVNGRGQFSFRAQDILRNGSNDVNFDLAVKKGFFLTSAINVLFMVSVEER